MFRVFAIAVLLTSVLQGSAFALEPERPGQGSFIKRAVVSAGQLYVLSDAGDLSSVQLDTYNKTRVDVDGSVLDLCTRPDGLAIAVDKPSAKVWAIEHFADGKWIADSTIASKGDEFVALACDSSEPMILTNHRLMGMDGRSVRLSKELYRTEVTSVLGTKLGLFVGIDAGEWGGGLRLIDRQTGRMSVIQYTATRALCDGPLNTDCDPVTAITNNPWNSDCIVITIGLVHMGMPRGRVDEVCGSHVKRLFFDPYPHPYRNDCKMGSGEPCETEPFFGVAASSDKVVAVADGGLYSITKDGKATHSSLPTFRAAGDIHIAYVPGFVLVLTDINERTSVSGSAPMLVPR